MAAFGARWASAVGMRWMTFGTETGSRGDKRSNVLGCSHSQGHGLPAVRPVVPYSTSQAQLGWCRLNHPNEILGGRSRSGWRL